jgi:hypothetical protein
MTRSSSLLVAGSLLVSAYFAGRANAQNNFIAVPWVYDPLNTGQAAGEWRANQGLPDRGGNRNYALYLQKNVPTSTEAAGGASVEGVRRITLSELGFDVRNDGWCGAGAPRFNVYTDQGTYYFFFGCYYGTHTPIAPNWTRVRFRNQDAYPAYATQSPWAGFGNVRVHSISIVFDEGTEVGPGYTYLDNIAINNTLIGKP